MVPFENLVTRNTHLKYLSPISSSFKVIAEIKVFTKGQGNKLWYHVKGFATRNTHVLYERPIISVLKVIARVKVFQKYVKLQGQGHKVKTNGTM